MSNDSKIKLLKNKSGIYKIINIINNRIYVGSAKNFYTRYCNHFYLLKKNKHFNKFLQNDFNKTGFEYFNFELIEITQINNLINTEQKYLNEYYDEQNICYNIRQIANSSLGKKISDEHKEKISKANKRKKLTEEHKQKLKGNPGNKAWTGKFHSIESKEKMSKYWLQYFSINTCPMTGKKNKWGHHTIETKNKIIKNLKNFSKPIIQINKQTNEIIKVFASTAETSRSLKISSTAITNCLTGVSKSSGGFYWKQMENLNV